MTASMVAEVRRRFGVPVVVRYTSTESSLGHRHHADVVRRGGGDHRGPPGGRRRAGHRRRRRQPGARRVGRPGPPAFRRGHARLLGPRPGPGSRASRTWSTPTATAAVLGAGRVADHRRLRAAHRPRATCSCRAGPTSATSGAATTSTRPRSRRPSRRTRPWPGPPWSACPTTSWARSAWRSSWPRRARRPTWRTLRAHCARAALRLQGARRAGGGRRAAADPDDEGRPGPPRRPGRARRRRSAGCRPGARVVVPAPGC